MKPFEFLAIFVSIILGLGTSHILSSAMRLIRSRNHLRINGPTVIWMVNLFLCQIFVWWLAFNRIESAHMTFFSFLLYLMIPISVSVPGYLLVPENEYFFESQTEYDLNEDFSRNRKWFFVILSILGITGYIDSVIRAGQLLFHWDNTMPFCIIALSVAGFLNGRRRGQLIIALTFLIMCLGYISLIFGRL
jgi:hypothetical protein